MKRIFLYIVFFLPLLLPAQTVISIKIDGTINPVAAAYIHRSLERAVSEKAVCLLIHLNTPGGLLKSTRLIVGDLLESRIPVIVYVSPPGAHAGSAGVFITLAADIAAMAPGTNIGAAHPVNMQGGLDSIMNSKATNDAAAFIRTIAEYRKRNLIWAEEAVRQSVAITAKEALEKNIIDFITPNDRELLNLADGKSITRDSATVVLHTRGATIETLEMGFSEKMLDLISDPDVAYILLMLGLFGLVFELFNPGIIFPGIIGFISLILAFYALNTMPVNYAGLALIVFGVVLLLLEVKVTSHGMLAIGGITALAIGSLMLIRPVSTLEFVRISRALIVSSVAVSACFFLFIIGMGLKAQRAKPVTGVEGMMGETGEAIDSLQPGGRVRVHGETWNAVSVSGNINKGEKVRVVEVKDLTLCVENIHSII
ncbi:MAG: nodulation protein NfeD [Bacteroidota bacterium]|nr:nodulation protein NfeD [Bacteroidota bacterium]